MSDTTTTRNDLYFIAFRANGADTFHHLAAFYDVDTKDKFKTYVESIGEPWGNWYNVPNKQAINDCVGRAQALGGISYYMKDDGFVAD